MNLHGKRLLFIKQSSLGDIIHTLPVAHALKRCVPDCTIGWVVERGLAPILEEDSTVDHVYPINIPSTSDPASGRGAYGRALIGTVNTLRYLRNTLNKCPYDYILDIHASFRSGLLGLTNPGGTRIGFAQARELNTFFQDRLVENDTGRKHALEINLLFAQHLGCPPEPADFFMNTTPISGQQAHDFMVKEGLAAGKRFVYMNPAARWQTKFWSTKKWALLADRFIDEDVEVVFGGSSNDRQYIAMITNQMEHTSIVSAGELSLTGSVALIKKASAYVGLDSGPMHIAAMVKTPVVALFGPTHPERVGPYRVEHRIVQAPGLECLCCRRRTCEHMHCMEAISVEQVFKAADQLIGVE